MHNHIKMIKKILNVTQQFYINGNINNALENCFIKIVGKSIRTNMLMFKK